MPKLIVGIAGEMGSGKEAVTHHLVNSYQAHSHNFSQIFNDILKRLHLEITRENQAPLSLALRKTFGEDILAKVMYHDSVEDATDVVVVQGIRRIEDMAYLKQLANFKFLYIDADMELRFERVSKRREKINDGTMSFEQFKASHQYETEKTIPDLRNYADYVVDNNGTYVELYAKIDEILKENI
ncbi:MAG: AAA family ATPase [Candidatus Moraniibacteriota bacterium]